MPLRELQSLVERQIKWLYPFCYRLKRITIENWQVKKVYLADIKELNSFNVLTEWYDSILRFFTIFSKRQKKIVFFRSEKMEKNNLDGYDLFMIDKLSIKPSFFEVTKNVLITIAGLVALTFMTIIILGV